MEYGSAKKQKLTESEDEVYLRIQGELFLVSKEQLCSHSEYFRAMFSGNYREADQPIIDMEVIDAPSMREILDFIRTGKIEPKQLEEASRLLSAATFLQLNELATNIQNQLIDSIDIESWLRVLDVAEAANAHRLARRAAAFGLYNVEEVSVRIDVFQTLTRLQWYLSHSHLAVEKEIEVFKMGAQWIGNRGSAFSNAALVVIGSLCIQNISSEDLECMIKHSVLEGQERASAILKCLLFLIDSGISTDTVVERENVIVERFSREVYEDVKVLVEGSAKRTNVRVPCIAASCDTHAEAHHLYRWCGTRGVERWLQLVDHGIWGWSWAVWGTHRLVVVGGEYSRGTGRFQRDVRIYDTLSGSWSDHGVRLPPRRHTAALVHEDTLYLVGGVGPYRVTLSTCIAYDLRRKTYVELPNLPETIQSPGITVHRGEIYVGGVSRMYVLRDRWQAVLELGVRVLVSAQGRLFVAQRYHKDLLQLSADQRSFTVHTTYINCLDSVCATGGELVAFLEGLMSEFACVETSAGERWVDESGTLRFFGVAGSGAVAIDLPPLQSTRRAAFALQCLREVSQDTS